MLEIQRLRQEQEQTVIDHTRFQRNPVLMAELRLLRQRRDELEMRMAALQDSRKELMIQLEGLMKLLRVSLNNPLARDIFIPPYPPMIYLHIL